MFFKYDVYTYLLAYYLLYEKKNKVIYNNELIGSTEVVLVLVLVVAFIKHSMYNQ